MKLRGKAWRIQRVAIVLSVTTAVLGSVWLNHRIAPAGLPSADEGGERREVDSAASLVPIPVEADTVRRGALSMEVTATGQAEAYRRSGLASLVAGRVMAFSGGEGDAVHAEQVLVRLDPRDALLAIDRAKAARAEATARFRELTLFDEEIADPAVRRDRSAAIRATTGLDRAEVALREAELAFARTTISAPFAGLVDDVRVAVGEHVDPGEDLLDVIDLDPIRVEIQVVESELRWLREGGGASVRLVAFPDTVFRGRIVAISPSVDSETRTGRVTVIVPNPDGAILPGMFALVALEGRVFADRLLVSKDAVIEREGRTLVFVFEPLPGGPPGEGLARWTYVTTGLANRRDVEIVPGDEPHLLASGSLVLTRGHLTLVHGARVRIAGAVNGHGARGH